MVELSAEAAERAGLRPSDRIDAPPLAPAEQAIDREHLARMTHGEHALEREVLQLFAMQADLLLGRMRDAAPKVIGALAHTLNGSARGIGAWPVAEAAEAVERNAARGGDLAEPRKRLLRALDEVQAAIAERLRA
jgi:Hpt domain-containing protein